MLTEITEGYFVVTTNVREVFVDSERKGITIRFFDGGHVHIPGCGVEEAKRVARELNLDEIRGRRV